MSSSSSDKKFGDPSVAPYDYVDNDHCDDDISDPYTIGYRRNQNSDNSSNHGGGKADGDGRDGGSSSQSYSQTGFSDMGYREIIGRVPVVADYDYHT